MLPLFGFAQDLNLKEGQEYRINHLGNKYVIDNQKILNINANASKVYQKVFELFF